MGFRLVFSSSDILLLLSLLVIVFCVWRSQRKALVKAAYKKLFQKKITYATFIVLVLYLGIAVLDSIHFQYALPSDQFSHKQQYEVSVHSVFDYLMGERATKFEKTYSSPFALTLYVKENSPDKGQIFPRLKYIPEDIKTIKDRNRAILAITLKASAMAAILILFASAFYTILNRDRLTSIAYLKRKLLFYILFSFFILSVVLTLYSLSLYFHVLGTGKVGQDIFFYTLKSIRTGLFIGLLTTLVMLPFALILGIAAGFFGKKVDDIIQYVYITVSSIPGVLLIAASVLSMQVFIVNHPAFFTSLSARADARLIALCVILGLTSWTGLCRMLRAETLKIREIDYIKAAKALGSSNTFILFKHILPNVMHLVLIAVVLDFSFLVLAEAVLSYIGVGVSPLTISWGNMINGARLELAREPIVWWPMTAAFIFMFILVLVINLFADAVRDAFDPRAD